MTTPILLKAKEKDIETIWKIRNSDLVRENSFNQDIIKYEDHCNWIKDKLNQYSILNHNQGYLRIDEHKYVSIAIKEDFCGNGIGYRILKDIKEGKAIIMLHNIISLIVFLKAGFLLKGLRLSKSKGSVPNVLSLFESETKGYGNSYKTLFSSGYILNGFYLEKK